MNTRNIILESAFSLFESRSFTDITVNQILEKANCSRYSFYKYFRDKYELMYIYYSGYVTHLLEEDYNGNNPFTAYKDDAGIMQQYAFFYKRNL